MSKKNILKRSLVLIVALAMVLGLASCKKAKEQIPYGNISDKVYAEGTGFTVTEKELYEEMRLQGLDILTKEFEKIVFKEELETVKNNLEDYREDLIKYANKAIFGTDKLEDLKEIEEKHIKQMVESFFDTMFLNGVSLNDADVDSTDFENHSSALLKEYYLNVAKKIYAKEKLADEVLDKDKSAYIDKEKDIEAYFKSTIEKRYPLSFISIRFSNSYEANQTLRHFNIKAYRQNWYLIPDPRTDVVDGYALTVLEGLGLEDLNGTGTLSELDHEKYYDKYAVNPERDEIEGSKDNKLTLDEVLYTILKIYNYVYPYKAIDLNNFTEITALEEILANEEFVKMDEEEKGLFTLEYDDFPINSQSESTLSSLRTYLYNTLSTDEDGTRYTASPRSFGKYYYVLFKLADHNEDLLEYVDEDKNFITFEEDEETLTEIAQEYYDKILENKLTDSYINSKATEKIKEAKVTIYDSDIHLFLGNDDYTLAKKFNNNLVAKVDDTEITVDDYFKLLENQYGVSLAMDLSIKKVLLSSEYRNKLTEKQLKEYEENMDNLIAQFSNNAFAGSGFPASIGRAKFLKLAFKANSKKEAIEKVYIAAEIEKLYLEDLEGHYGTDIYEKFLELANKLQKQTFSITTGHLIVKIDMDEDENPDDPKDFFETLSPAEVTKYKDAITELLTLIYTKASKYQNFEQGLENIVRLYNDSARFISEDIIVEDDDEENKNVLAGPEKDWAKFKQLGLQLEYQALGTQTNKTNWPGEANFDEKFFDRLVEFYDHLKEEYYDVDEKFPTQLLDNQKPVTYDDVLETSFGWHLVLALGGDVSSSSKFTIDDDSYIDGDSSKDKIYEKIELFDENEKLIDTLDAYSDTDEISLNQLRVYLHERESDYDINLPSKVRTAINNYLVPILEKYENSREMTLHLLHKLILDKDFTYANSDNEAKLAHILEINKKQFLSYATAESNKEYFDIFGDWFTIFN